MSTRCRRMRALWQALACLLLSHAAHASDPAVEQAKQYFRAGAQAYAVGEYDAAVQAFEQAYALAPRPAVLFSIAQAERRQYFFDRKREHLLKAIQMYQKYLEEEPHAARKVDAIQALSELEPLLASTPPEGGAESSPLKIVALPTRIMISSPAPDAQIALDGRVASLSPLIREVDPGRHLVQVSAPGFLESSRSVVAVKGAFVTVDVPLTELPGKLVVIAPDGALLSIDGRTEGECPFPRPLELPAGKHLVTLTKKGFVGVSGEQLLVRGRTTVVRATMPRSVQRTAAQLMLGAAASSLVAGAVFGYFALDQEGTARGIRDARGRASLTPEDRVLYESARSNRDRFRTAALLSVGSAAGLVVGGMFLLAVDGRMVKERDHTRPRLGREQAQHPRRSPTAEPSLAAAPMIGPGTLGLGISGSF